MVGVLAGLWLAAWLAHTPAPECRDETLWMVYALGRRTFERIAICAVVASLLVALSLIVVGVETVSGDLARLRLPCVDDAVRAGCYAVVPGRGVRWVRWDQMGDYDG